MGRFDVTRSTTLVVPGCVAIAAVLLVIVGFARPLAGDTIGSRKPRIVTLLDDQSVVLLSLEGHQLDRLQLPTGIEERPPGRYLAISPDGMRIYVLPPADPGRRAQVVEIDTATFEVERKFTLAPNVVYRDLELGRRSGRLIALGNREGSKMTRLGFPEDAALVTVVETSNDKVQTRLIKAASRRNWRVYRGALSANEQALAISYHGQDTTGADIFELGRSTLASCRARMAPPYVGCLAEVHGAVEVDGGFVYGTTGSRGGVVRIPLGGAPSREWRVHLPRNHLMELVVDRTSKRLYAFGGCDYAGGLTRIDLVRSRVHRLVPSAAPGALPDVCGARGAVAGRTLVLARPVAPAVRTRRGSTLGFVDISTGRVARTVALPGDPLDVAVLHG